MPKRYRISDKYPGNLLIKEDQEGEWVRYEDIKPTTEVLGRDSLKSSGNTYIPSAKEVRDSNEYMEGMRW